MRLQEGVVFRFDSIPEMEAFCRDRYPGIKVWTVSGGEFVLRARLANGFKFESLIVHFEGEGCYAVMLPAPDTPAPESVWTKIGRWWRRGPRRDE